MLTRSATPEMAEAWKAVSAAYRPRLRPNRAPAEALVDYLKNRYPLLEMKDKRWNRLVEQSVLQNEWAAEKLQGRKPRAVVFSLENRGEGARLYQEQEPLFQGQAIVAGIELETGYFHVEGAANYGTSCLPPGAGRAGFAK